jgi:8-oxo-dGTP diphosphatase
MKLFYVGIKGAIIQNGKILLLKTNDLLAEKQDFWELPGGRIEDEETFEQALHRELREELPNIKDIVIYEMLHASRIKKDLKDNVSLTLIFFKVSADFDGKIQLSDEHIGYKWVDRAEASKLVQPETRGAIIKIFENA